MQHTHLFPTPAASALVTSPPASTWEDQVWQEKDRFWGFGSPHECNWGEFWRESQGHSLFCRTLGVTCQDPATWSLSTTTHKGPQKQPGSHQAESLLRRWSAGSSAEAKRSLVWPGPGRVPPPSSPGVLGRALATVFFQGSSWDPSLLPSSTWGVKGVPPSVPMVKEAIIPGDSL